MKKFIKSVLLFIPFATAIYLLLLIIGGDFVPKAVQNLYYPLGFNHMLTKMKEARLTKDIDILFLGSSHAERGFDVRVFEKAGYKSFNLGTAAQTPLQTEMLLNRYLDSLNPKIVIYDIYSGIFTIDGVEAGLRLIANDRNDKYSVEMALKTNNVKMYNTLLYAFYRDWFGRNEKIDSSKLIPSTGVYIGGGYTEKEMQYFKYLSYPDSSTWNYEQYQFDAFERTLEQLRSKDINVVLVQTPVTSAYYRSYTNNCAFDSYMSSRQGLPYYNFNNILYLDDSLHFYDYDHLNQKGAEIYNRELINRLFAESTSTLD